VLHIDAKTLCDLHIQAAFISDMAEPLRAYADLTETPIELNQFETALTGKN
jgi:hypothetical protein